MKMAAYPCFVGGTPFPLTGKGLDRGARKPIRTITPTFVLPRQRLCRNARMAHTCHLRRSERSCIFSYMRRKDFSPLARNDNCDTVSQGEGLGPCRRFGFFISRPLTPPQSNFSKKLTKSTKSRSVRISIFETFVVFVCFVVRS
jgi:hypothetical protein